MAKLEILIPGYAREEKGGEYASSTTTLIQDKGLNIVVDPGMNRNKLLASLKRAGLSLSDIDFVFLTHMHSDHSLLTGIFESAKVVDDSSIYSWDGRIEDHDGKIPGTEIKIIKTPGHDIFQGTLLVDTKDYGKVAIASDVFFWTDNEVQKIDRASLLAKKDPYVKNEKQLRQSRSKILKVADYVVPGHGKIFKVEK